MEKNVKLESLAETLKVLKEIERDNDLQYQYVDMYWKKLRKCNKLYKTIDDERYYLISEIAEDIKALQTRLSFLINVMIDDCLNEKIGV